MHIRFWYRGRFHEQYINSEITLRECYARCARFLEAGGSEDDYIFFCPQVQEINDTKLSKVIPSSLQLVGEPIDIYLSIKTDADKMKTFCNSLFHSVRYEAIMMSQDTYKMHINMNYLHRKVLKIYSKTNKNFNSIIPKEISGYTVETLKNLLQWFISSCIKKYVIPKCKNCQESTVKWEEDRPPTEAEKRSGAIGAKKFTCNHCKAAIRIPEFEDADLIFKASTGCTIEQCILFGQILRQYGFEIRLCKLVSHTSAWIEAYIPDEQRFVPCDLEYGLVNQPLILVGHKIPIDYVIAVGPYECTDITIKYTNQIDQVFEQRGAIIEEDIFQQILGLKQTMWRYNAPENIISDVDNRVSSDFNNFDPIDREPNDLEKSRDALIANFTSRLMP